MQTATEVAVNLDLALFADAGIAWSESNELALHFATGSKPSAQRLRLR